MEALLLHVANYDAELVRGVQLGFSGSQRIVNVTRWYICDRLPAICPETLGSGL